MEGTNGKDKLCKIVRATDKETMRMLMRDKPTRYHSNNDTNSTKNIHSLLKLSARIPSSSTVVSPHPFKDSCDTTSSGRVWVGDDTGAVCTSASGSTSTMLKTAFPSRTRRILSTSQVEEPPLGDDASPDGNCVVKACQKAPPSR